MALEAQKSKLTGKLTDLQKDLGFAKFIAGPSSDPVIAGKNVFVYTDNKLIRQTLQDIIKKTNADYKATSGISSKGSAVWTEGDYAGLELAVKPFKDTSLNTDEQETLQGIFIATKFNNPNTTYQRDDLKKYGDPKIDSRYKINDLFMKTKKPWFDSSIRTAEKAFELKGKLGIRSDFRVQQRSNSKFVDNISKAAGKLIKEAGFKMGLDKWNPADIYLVHPNLINTNFNRFTGIVQLNKWILDHFQQGKLIPVSLKFTGNNVKHEIRNPNTVDKMFDYEKYDLGKTGYTGSLYGNIYYTGGSIQLRNFGRPESISGEINGKFAQGGKVKLSIFVEAIKRVGGNMRTKTHQEIRAMYEKTPTMLYDKLHKDMLELTNERLTRDQLSSEVEVKDNKINYVISKYQVGDLLRAFNKLSKERKNQVLSAAVGYAGSETEISSVHLKIY
tara:strand:- start:2977 stop:4311 length:1335 start_codon:yes stop_codon:yes gene_type:complete